MLSRYRYGLVVLGIVLALSLEGGLRMLLFSSPLSLIMMTKKEEPGGQHRGSIVYTRNKSSTPAAARDMVGEWLGQTWVPPHPWRLFGPTELLKLYQNKKVLWIGDSTGRRFFATTYAILQETSNSSDSGNRNGANHVSNAAMDHPNVIDINKKNRTEFCTKWGNENVAAANAQNLLYPGICRATPGSKSRGEFSYANAVCYSTIENFLASELAGTTNITADVDVIVIAAGIWEVIRKAICNAYDKKNTTTGTRSAMQCLDDALEVAAKFTSQTGKVIIWRTAGYGDSSTVAPVNALNNRTMDFIDSLLGNDDDSSSNNSKNRKKNNNLVYVNWGGAVLPRSFGEDNIAGDIAPHYGK
jgi:hypothetical protein